MAETPNERRLRLEREADALTLTGAYDARRSPLRRLRNAVSGTDDYGTSLSAGAEAAGAEQVNREFNEQGRSVREALTSPTARQKMREAAAQERREARGMKHGGKTKGYAKGGVTRGDGCISKGHTKGKMR